MMTHDTSYQLADLFGMHLARKRSRAGAAPLVSSRMYVAINKMQQSAGVATH
jgi:hypothetical protein